MLRKLAIIFCYFLLNQPWIYPAFADGVQVMPKSEIKLIGNRKFGFAMVFKQNVSLNFGENYFGEFNPQQWLSYSELENLLDPKNEKNQIAGQVNLFGKNGFACNVKITKDIKGEGVFDGKISRDCAGRLLGSPESTQMQFVLFVYPSFENFAVQSKKQTIPKEDKDIILSSIENLTNQYVLEKKVKNLNLKKLKARTTMDKIGANINVSQYFVVNKAGSIESFQKNEYWNLNVFSFIVQISDGKLSVSRVYFSPSGNDSSGRISCDIIADLDQDGIIDMFYIHAGCCGYVILFDGEKWIEIGATVPA
jgi:hypothetical protein